MMVSALAWAVQAEEIPRALVPAADAARKAAAGVLAARLLLPFADVLTLDDVPPARLRSRRGDGTAPTSV